MTHPALTSPIYVRNAGGYLVECDEPVAAPPLLAPELVPNAQPDRIGNPALHAADGCRVMLKRMLYSGQHFHPTAAARIYAERLGFDPKKVKPGIGL